MAGIEFIPNKVIISRYELILPIYTTTGVFFWTSHTRGHLYTPSMFLSFFFFCSTLLIIFVKFFTHSEKFNYFFPMLARSKFSSTRVQIQMQKPKGYSDWFLLLNRLNSVISPLVITVSYLIVLLFFLFLHESNFLLDGWVGLRVLFFLFYFILFRSMYSTYAMQFCKMR